MKYIVTESQFDNILDKVEELMKLRLEYNDIPVEKIKITRKPSFTMHDMGLNVTVKLGDKTLVNKKKASEIIDEVISYLVTYGKNHTIKII